MKVVDTMSSAIEYVYEHIDARGTEEYHQTYGGDSQCILTITDPAKARRAVQLWRDQLEGKRVVEIGAGVGLFACEAAKIAKHVYAIEADPAWSWIFTKYLYATKPKNLSWLFGVAEEFIGMIKADVAIVFAHSGLDYFKELGAKFAPEVILGYQSWDTLINSPITGTKKGRAVQ